MNEGNFFQSEDEKAQARQQRQNNGQAEQQPGSRPNGRDPTEPHFRLVRARDIKLDTSPSYLVHGLIPREGLIVVWGPPKCGKTFWVHDAMMHITLDWEYRGRRVEPGTVVYIACEGERGLAARNAAFWQTSLAENADPPFYLLTTRLDLPGEVDALALDIAAQIPAGPVAAIVLDTLNRSIRGSESKDEDMSGYIVAADALRARFKCAVIIVHHCGVNDSRPRGHTSLTGACDAQIAVRRDVDGKIITILEWMKDGPEDCEIVSRLKPVEIGLDDNGTPITSCVVIAAEGAGKSKPSPKQPSLPPAAKIALKQLRNAISTDGKPVPPASGAPENVVGVDIDLWRRFAYQGGISAGESASAQRNAFLRAMEKLVAGEMVGVWGDWAWIP